MVYYCDNKRHLICTPYTVENLHKMANDLNIKYCWFHAHDKFPHYDIPKKRVNGIMEKCNLVSTKELLNLIKK